MYVDLKKNSSVILRVKFDLSGEEDWRIIVYNIVNGSCRDDTSIAQLSSRRVTLR